MKKIYFLLFALVVTSGSFAQTISNPGMETWRTSTSGGSTPISITAPTDWYGTDSVIIALGQQYGGLAGIADTAWQRQIFKQSSILHSGNYSAMLMTARDSFIGNIAGILSNALITISINPLTMTVSPPSYSGGTAITQRVSSVSAWTQYSAGIDSVTGLRGDIDSGVLTVQVLANIAGTDSVIGTGTTKIGPSSSFTQIVSNITYTDSTYGADLLRIIFSSSGQTGALDSSVLYIDDVSFMSVEGVSTVLMKNNIVSIYPNPASETIYMDGPQNRQLECELFSVNGQSVATKTFTGNTTLDASHLAAGLYFYTISDTNGNKVQRGKITVTR